MMSMVNRLQDLVPGVQDKVYPGADVIWKLCPVGDVDLGDLDLRKITTKCTS